LKPLIYFPGLNGLRAIAAMIVMIFHTDQFSHYFGLASQGIWRLRTQSYAVILFFVLSGFLITFLLIQEKENTGKINVRQFYIRRVRRIWPVYYLVLIAGIVLIWLFPEQIHRGINPGLGITALGYAFFIPNVVSFFGYTPDLINVLWSVGAEEQFYAFWPWVIKNASDLLNHITWFLLAWLVFKYYLNWLHFPKSGWSLGEYLPFDYMAIGGIAACGYHGRSKMLDFVYHPAVQIIAWLFFVISVLYRPVHISWLGLLNTDLHAVVYAIILLNVGTNAKTLVSLENRVLNFMGKISYGIYGFHFIVLFLASRLLNNWLPALPVTAARFIQYGSVISITVVMAYLSWRFYESKFRKPVQAEEAQCPFPK